MAKQSDDPKFVEVHWLDAVSHSGWVGDVKGCKPILVIQRGWLLESDKERVVISMSKPDAHPDYLGVQTIPRGMVKDWWEIEVVGES